MAQYSIITAPAGGVLSLATLKAFLRLDPAYTSEDTVLTMILSSVQSTFERYTGLVLQSTVFELTNSSMSIEAVIHIAKSPVTAISSVKVLIDGTYQTITDYTTSLGYNSHVHIDGFFPSYGEHTSFKIQFTAGLTTIPEDIKMAMYQASAYAYENRGYCAVDGSGFPQSAKNVYDSYKVIWI